ncbi:hypothetical protein ACHAQA_009910 [Verticillium albo-atrum]
MSASTSIASLSPAERDRTFILASSEISKVNLDSSSADIVDVGAALWKLHINDPRSVPDESPQLSTDVPTLQSHLRTFREMVKDQGHMLQKSKAIIQDLDEQIVADIALLNDKNTRLWEKSDKLRETSNKLFHCKRELLKANFLINDLSEKLVYQHRELKMAISMVGNSSARQRHIIELLEEASRYGLEPVQAMIGNWGAILGEDDAIGDLNDDAEDVGQLLHSVVARNEEHARSAMGLES